MFDVPGMNMVREAMAQAASLATLEQVFMPPTGAPCVDERGPFTFEN